MVNSFLSVEDAASEVDQEHELELEEVAGGQEALCSFMEVRILRCQFVATWNSQICC